MNYVYLDNAATTPLAPEVIEVMRESLASNFGNPSSTHQMGRKAKAALENARKTIAQALHVTSKEIIFTSSGTEANNLILFNAIHNYGVKRIITSKIEHHAVLHPCEFYAENHEVQLDFVNLEANGQIDLRHLEELLANSQKKTLVSLMMINNELGNILPIREVSEICKRFEALFHSDTVQVIGHYVLNLKEIPIDFITASAHKFHGPKGVGFAYFKSGFSVKPLLLGGDQEKGARSSTENIHGILGMEKALELALKDLDKDIEEVKTIKAYFKDELVKISSGIQFNGVSSDLEKSSYTILNVRFPVKNNMLLFQLDMMGVGVSSGSACQSGASKVSHVLAEVLNEQEQSNASIRFSFSRYTTKEDIDYSLHQLKSQLKI